MLLIKIIDKKNKIFDFFKNKNFKTHYFPAIFLFLFVIASRYQTFGNPLLNMDEDFYLFCGGLVLHGNLPYIDFWDRKPVLLFLLYAVFHIFGSYSVIAYQVGALLAVWATCFLLFQMASTITSRNGALLISMLYCIGLTLCGGEGGQTPVFYTLLVTAAMRLFFFKIIHTTHNPQHIRKIGILAMGFIGIAIQIKYTVIFEGIFLGVYCIWIDIKNKRKHIDCIVDIIMWVGVALLPTGLAFLYYALIGHGQEWIFANFRSIFLRAPPPIENNYIQMKVLKNIAPLIIGMVISILWLRKTSQKDERQFISLWALSSCLGVIIFGCRYEHYLLPVFAPLALANAILWNVTAGRYWLVILLLLGFFRGQNHIHNHILKNGNKSTYNTLLNAMPDSKGCLFIYDGSTALYDTSHWCALTNHPFPAHFSELPEFSATGMNPFTELKHILSQKPKYIMLGSPSPTSDNPQLRKYIETYIVRDYKEIYRSEDNDKYLIIYQFEGSKKSLEHNPI